MQDAQHNQHVDKSEAVVVNNEGSLESPEDDENEREIVPSDTGKETPVEMVTLCIRSEVSSTLHVSHKTTHCHFVCIICEVSFLVNLHHCVLMRDCVAQARTHIRICVNTFI
jgi:hypothetical protein